MNLASSIMDTRCPLARGGQNKPKTENQTEPNGYRFFGFGFSVIGFGFGFHLVLISVIGSVSVSLKKIIG